MRIARLILIALILLPLQGCGTWFFACTEAKPRPPFCDA